MSLLLADAKSNLRTADPIKEIMKPFGGPVLQWEASPISWPLWTSLASVWRVL